MAIGCVQEALDSNEFRLFYQPKVDMRSGRVLVFEALLRWRPPAARPDRAVKKFLPLIENTGLSARVGDWVFSQALEHLSHWRRNGLDISVSVNVRRATCRSRTSRSACRNCSRATATRTAPHLELEVLETAAHNDIEATSALLARCRAIGVRFALDDFGTGYPPHLPEGLPVDVLEDRPQLRPPHARRPAGPRHCRRRDRPRAHLRLRRRRRRRGEPGAGRALLDLGCDIGSGTGIAAPMTADQVATWARDYRWRARRRRRPQDSGGVAARLGG